MLVLRRLVLAGVLKNSSLTPSKDINFVKDIKSLVVPQRQLPNHFGYGRRSYCRPSNEFEELEEEEFGAVPCNSEEDNLKREEIFKEISNGDPEVLKSLKLLEFEVAVLRNDGCRVPSSLNKRQWEELLTLSTLCQRRKFLTFLRINEMKRLSNKKKLEIRVANARRQKEEDGFFHYGLGGHTMFLRVYEKTITNLLNLRRFSHEGPHIVFDCSYQEYMSSVNVKNCAKQIAYSIITSRLHRQPCTIDLCNVNLNDNLSKELPRYALNFPDRADCSVFQQNYLELYPKEKLVYLSPHAHEELVFDPENIFIIGAFVDKGTGVKASLAKAKQDKIRCAKFPLDKYLTWRQGTKSFPLNIVTQILLDMYFYKDWNKAFRTVPNRCVSNSSWDSGAKFF